MDDAAITCQAFTALAFVCALMTVSFCCYLRERAIHPFRKLSRLFRRPPDEVAVALLFTVGIVYYGATKPARSPKQPQSLPRPEITTPLPTQPVTSDAPLFPAWTNAVESLCISGIQPAETSVFLRAHWPENISPAPTGIEVYAAPTLETNGWAGIGTAPIQASDTSMIIELPHSLLPETCRNSVFFQLGFNTDSDQDGLSDSFERIVSLTDADLADTDGDGMPDGWEYRHGFDPGSTSGADEAGGDYDGDGLANIWEYRCGTDPHNGDSDCDMLPDGAECGWWEDSVTNIPWFAIQPLSTFRPGGDIDRGLFVCPMPFTNRLAGSRIDLAVADVNGVVYFANRDTTNHVSSSDSPVDLSVAQGRYCASVAAYSSNLAMRGIAGASVTFGTAVADGTNRFFVIQYLNIGTYSGGTNTVSLQVSVPESRPDVVYVRYGTVTDTRSVGYVSIGAQGARVGNFGNLPLLSYYFESRPPVIEPGMTLAFHFGSGSDPLLSDTDGDGLDDRIEHIIGTDPRCGDTDGDGFGDAVEIEYGMNPASAAGRDGAEGDLDGDGLPNGKESEFGTSLIVADCDGDGLLDGEETGYIAVTNAIPWLEFDQYEDCTEDLVYETNRRYHVSRALPCPLLVQGEQVTNITFTSYGWFYLNRAGLADRARGDGVCNFSNPVDRDTLAIAAFGSSSMFVEPNAAVRPTRIRYGTATYNGAGYILLEYSNLYRDLKSYMTNSVSFQIAMPTNRADRLSIQYRDVNGKYMDGRSCAIGMQIFDGRWLHSFCYQDAGLVYDGLGLLFAFGQNSDPLRLDSDGDGISDGDESGLGTNPAHTDSDGDGLPDGWERDHGLDPLSAAGDDGACGDSDGDGLPNGGEYDYGTNPLISDTDGDGLADGREVVGTFLNPSLPWVTLHSPADITDAFSNRWQCVNLALPRPVQVQRETVECISVDPHGVIYLNRAGYVTTRQQSTGGMLNYPIDRNCTVIAPYWSELEFAGAARPTRIRTGTSVIGTNECFVIEYSNLYLRPARYGDAYSVSFQVSIPLGRVDRVCVKYADVTGLRMDGREAMIGFQTFGFGRYSEYCRNEECKISDGTGVVFILGYGTDPNQADTDRDGLTDAAEVNGPGSDPCAADTDGDGLADGVEVENGTSPVNADTDDDGMPDGWEVENGLDPLSPAGDDGADGDPDNDSLINIREYEIGSNPNNADTDGDGLSDSLEAALGTMAAVADTDGDGLSDGDEVARGTDPVRADTDGDGLRDGWEVAYGFNPLTPGGEAGETSGDDDGDGLTNLEEMRNGTNPHMADTDGDGLGDSEEVSIGTSPLRQDTDYDGLSDLQELELGLNPRQPDTDGDGLNDGWEYSYRNFGFDPLTADADDPQRKTGPNDDLDGDGLPNSGECSFRTNPGAEDTDGDGAGDGEEVVNSSDPADSSDNGEPKSRVPVQFYFGDPSGSHSEKYRLSVTPEEGPEGEDTPSGGHWLNEQYGRCETKTVMLKPGWKYAVRLYHASTVPGFDDWPNPDYDYELSCRSSDGLVIIDDREKLFGGNGNSGETFTGEGKVAYVVVLRIEHELLWETANKCNQIFNPTPKDDFTGENNTNETEGDYTYSAPRNYLYVVSDPFSKTYNVTEKIKPIGIPAGYASKLLCAAFVDDVSVPDSAVTFSPDFEAAMRIQEMNGITNVYSIRVGVDSDGDKELSVDESIPLEVYKYNGTSRYAVVCGTSLGQYAVDNKYIEGKLAGLQGTLAGIALPFASSLLSIFYYGGDSAVPAQLKPESRQLVSMNAFASCSGFSEWLTHNSGAGFDENGSAQIVEYYWGPESMMSQFMARRKPLTPWLSYTVYTPAWSGMTPSTCYALTSTGEKLRKFYAEKVLDRAKALLADSADGAIEILRAAPDTWKDESLEKLIFGERNTVVPTSTTQVFGEKGTYQRAKGVASAFGATALSGGSFLNDLDAFLSIGRGRLLAPVYSFKVRKTNHWFGEPTYDLISIGFSCTITDLYDFNFADGDLSRRAAVLQLGYGRGAYNRENGLIYRHQIRIDTEYYNPFIQ